MLEVRDLAVTYRGAVQALRGVSLQVPSGSVAAVLGPNGAGKSTLLRAISNSIGLLRGRIEAGLISLDGRVITGLAPPAIVGLGIVQSPEGRHILGRLTVAENLDVGAFGERDPRRRAAAEALVYDLFPVLSSRRRERASLLSGGQQQMLAIGRALMATPRYLLLDEPSLGLAPQVVAQIADAIRAINAAGTAVLLVEQNAAMALSLATAAVVLELGRVSLSGSAEDLAATDAVRRLYLGQGEGGEGTRIADLRASRNRRGLGRWAA